MNVFDKYKIPRFVMVPIQDLKSGEMNYTLVKEGSKLHKFYMEAINGKRLPAKSEEK